MTFFEIKKKLKAIFLSFCIFSASLGYACEAKSSDNMVSDDAGNIYAIWSIDGKPNVSIKQANSPNWDLFTQLSQYRASYTKIAATDDGQVLIAWMSETENPYVYAIFVSMYVNGTWTTPFAITDPSESILNSFDMSICYNPTTAQTEMNFMWMSYYNGEVVMRTNTGVYGNNNNWSGPTTLPINVS